ncbi:MAG: hypothetical protein ACYDAJ_09025 [Nitrosotalea sp.]
MSKKPYVKKSTSVFFISNTTSDEDMDHYLKQFYSLEEYHQKENMTKDEAIKELVKRLQEMSKELQEERNDVDRFRKIVNGHKCNKDDTFISEIETDE